MRKSIFLERKTFVFSPESIGKVDGIRVLERGHGYSTWIDFSLPMAEWVAGVFYEAIIGNKKIDRWTEREGPFSFLAEIKANAGGEFLRISRFGGAGIARTFCLCIPAGEKNFCWWAFGDTGIARTLATPDNEEWPKFVIRIKQGVYEEIFRIPLRKKNVVFLGDGMGKTVITGSLNVGQPGLSTYNTATVGVLGDGFMARDLTFENTAGPDAHQAVAFRSDSDQSIIENCEFLGNQDTLYARALRQLYNQCRIEGNVDFIFGNSAAVFQNSIILIRPRQLSPEHGETNTVTAHGRTDPAQSTGFVFQNCLINGTNEYMKLYYQNPKVHKNYLGRPWKEFSRTLFIDCYLGDLITPQGWMPWDRDFALSTLYYGELGNSGLGANLSARVPWSSQIPKEYTKAYSLRNFIQADEWISSSS
ncbi:Pectinesterase [Macleaya cordata]|uniref:pectinesterase n=1 Tax=Macleaya cordata TaxID=56857 RepID=A0A200PTG4_MACCD|nr:Pectinesterase [Macleaya cordata]